MVRAGHRGAAQPRHQRAVDELPRRGQRGGRLLQQGHQRHRPAGHRLALRGDPLLPARHLRVRLCRVQGRPHLRDLRQLCGRTATVSQHLPSSQQ